MKYSLITLGAAATLTFAGGGAFAQNPDPNVFILADSHGHGFLISYNFLTPLDTYIAPDPGPGGSTTALTYSLENPPSVVPGDVFLLDPTGTYYSGLVRFNPGDANTSASFVFYSEENGPASGPTDLYGNQALTFDNPAGYTEYIPGANDPGYVEGFDVEYAFFSDAIVPEPSTYAALGLGVLGVVTLVLRSRRRTFTV